MLKNLREKAPLSCIMRIGNSSLPLFKSELEYNPPVHGTWNIVHIGMQIPESHQIYVCSDNCMRGVVMTAAEMNCLDRFSQVVLKDHDLYDGNLEEVTINGVIDIINRLHYKPKAVLVFTVCLHHFMGSDLRRIGDELNAHFPDIDIIMCLMDPIMQKEGLSPEAKLRDKELQLIRPLDVNQQAVALLGADIPVDESSDLIELIKSNGCTVTQIADCQTYDDFLALGQSTLFINYYLTGEYGVRRLSRRLHRSYFNLPSTFCYDSIDESYQQLCELMGWQQVDTSKLRNEAEKALAHLKEVIGNTPIMIDYIAHPQPLSMAELLLNHGFNVECIYIDAVTADEIETYQRLKERYPDLILKATIHVGMRYYYQHHDEIVIGIGQKAAFFENTPHFVNIVEGGGLWGYKGIVKLCALIEEAYYEEKDTADIVVRKGLGCESCL
ncbi:MAG: hypothetical protein J6P61_06725 [Erysipelotrichaceae bacterium]|nr:hypothetical protein [Erysipelotrichaceae bacterium]